MCACAVAAAHACTHRPQRICFFFIRLVIRRFHDSQKRSATSALAAFFVKQKEAGKAGITPRVPTTSKGAQTATTMAEEGQEHGMVPAGELVRGGPR